MKRDLQAPCRTEGCLEASQLSQMAIRCPWVKLKGTQRPLGLTERHLEDDRKECVTLWGINKPILRLLC